VTGHVIGAPKGGRSCRAAASPPPTQGKLKKKIMDMKALCDIHFSQKQPLKSAGDWYIAILKNKIRS